MQTLPFPQTMLMACGLPRSARRRAWALLLALALVLASFMHVAHTHDADAPASYGFCSFCTTLDRGSAPPPVVAAAVLPVSTATNTALPAIEAPTGTSGRTPHHPRAPPALQA